MDWQTSSKLRQQMSARRCFALIPCKQLSSFTSPRPPLVDSRSGKSEVLARFDNQPSASLTANVSPDPLEEDAETQAALSKKLYVDQCPDKPREEATDLYRTAL